jgi:ribosomal protein L30/L7E
MYNGMSREEAFRMMCGAARKGQDPGRAVMSAAMAQPDRAAPPPGFERTATGMLRPDSTTQSYLDWRKRNRTTVTKDTESVRKEVKKIKNEELCCSCRKTIPAGGGKAGWQASHNFATYGEGSTRKNVVFWFHTACCPDSDPITEALALDFFLGNKNHLRSVRRPPAARMPSTRIRGRRSPKSEMMRARTVHARRRTAVGVANGSAGCAHARSVRVVDDYEMTRRVRKAPAGEG